MQKVIKDSFIDKLKISALCSVSKVSRIASAISGAAADLKHIVNEKWLAMICSIYYVEKFSLMLCKQNNLKF